MIGFIIGVILASNYVGIAWTGTPIEISMFAVLIVIGIGIILFPRTVGIAFTPMAIAAPFLFVISWAKFDLSYALQVFLLGAVAWLVTFVVSIIRKDAV